MEHKIEVKEVYFCLNCEDWAKHKNRVLVKGASYSKHVPCFSFQTGIYIYCYTLCMNSRLNNFYINENTKGGRNHNCQKQTKNKCQNPNSTNSSIELNLRFDYILTARSTHQPPTTNYLLLLSAQLPVCITIQSQTS